MPEALVVALVDGEAVGYAGMRRNGHDVADRGEHADGREAPLPRPRHRDGAEARPDRRARAAGGIEQLFTTNDEKNAGMREVNKRLGYKPLPAEIVVSGPLAPSRATPG